MKVVSPTIINCILLLAGLTACSKPLPDEPVPAPPQTQAPSVGATQRTATGAYLVTLQPQKGPVHIGEQQPWIARITDASGLDFAPKSLYFDGGIPGDWRIVVTVEGPAGAGHAEFNFNIRPIATAATQQTTSSWSTSELALMNSLRVGNQTTPADPSNNFLHNAIALGEALFNATELSAFGNVSCATCHNSALGMAVGKQLGFGSATTKRRTNRRWT